MAPSATAMRPAAEATLTMCPRPRSAIPGAIALVPLIRPCTLTSMTDLVTASGSLSTEPSGMMPALLTSTSTGPTSPTVARKVRHDSALVTSSRAPTAPRPIRSATCCTRTSSRSPSATVAPIPASSSAVAWPMPRAAPVITMESPEMSRFVIA